MKRIFLGLILIIFSIDNSFGADPVVVKSGNIQVFTEESTALLKFVYGTAEVNGYPMDEYIENKGGCEYEEKWDKWLKKAERFFVYDFNKRNKGMKVTQDVKSPVKYTVTIIFNTLETGNTFKGILPKMSLKDNSGSAMMNGTLEVKDTQGKSMCVLSLRNIYGTSGFKTSIRLMTLFLEIDKRIRKAVKKAAGTNGELYTEETYEEDSNDTEFVEDKEENDIDEDDEDEEEVNSGDDEEDEEVEDDEVEDDEGEEDEDDEEDEYDEDEED